MATLPPNLKKSATGFYKYRRKVPEGLREHFPRTKKGGTMAEWQTSFKTKDRATAEKLWLLENRKFDAALKSAERLSRGSSDQTSDDILAAAHRLLTDSSIHPDQAPKLPPIPTEDDITIYTEKMRLWREQTLEDRALLAELAYEDAIDYDQVKQAYALGKWHPEHYEEPLKKRSRTVAIVAEKILKGDEAKGKALPTWGEAVDLYVSVNKHYKTRERTKEQIWETKTRSLLTKFGKAMGGMETPLDDLDRTKVRQWLTNDFSSWSTRNRYNSTLSAVINLWNREHKEQVHNPFTGLSSKKKEQEEALDRRSFRPAELEQYIGELKRSRNHELRLIGLLMVYTGCRTAEAACLQVKDLKLNASVPHVIFRPNKLRRMDKEGLERTVPLVPELIAALSDYQAPTDPEAALFPRYGSTKGTTTVSANLANIIRKKMGIQDKTLVPYSTRHTLKDRLVAARIDEPTRHFLLGHKSHGSSRLHDKYGTGEPPGTFLKDLEAALEQPDWGYFDD